MRGRMAYTSTNGWESKYHHYDESEVCVHAGYKVGDMEEDDDDWGNDDDSSEDYE